MQHEVVGMEIRSKSLYGGRDIYVMVEYSISVAEGANMHLSIISRIISVEMI